MSSLNKATLIGHVGQDPQIKTLQSGVKMANISIATSEKWTDKHTGEKREKTEWHRIVIFNEGLVNLVENYVRKGNKIYIEGSIETRKWQDQQGVDRYSTEIVLKAYNGRIILLSSKNEGGGQSGGGGRGDGGGRGGGRGGGQGGGSQDGSQDDDWAGGWGGGQPAQGPVTAIGGGVVGATAETPFDDEIPF